MGWLWLRARTQEGSAWDRMLTLPLRVCGSALQLTAGKQVNVCNGRGTWPDVAYYYHSYYLSIWLLSIFLGSLQIWSKTATGIWTQMSIWQVRQLLNTKMLGKWVGTQRCHSLYLYFYMIHLFVYFWLSGVLGKSEKGRKSGNRVVIILPGVPGWTFIRDFNHWSVLENLGLATEQTESIPVSLRISSGQVLANRWGVCRDV